MKQINTYINEKLRLSAKPQYTCHPKDKYELWAIIKNRIENEGNECDLNDIDTSKITDMSYLFDARDYNYVGNLLKQFNGDVSQWDVSNVEIMTGMFYRCYNFNCDISNWDVSNVKNMYEMFYKCEKFNCNISKWNVSKVKDMKGAFYNCPTQPDWYDKDKWE